MKLSFLDIFIILVIMVILFLYIRQYYGEVSMVKSKVDGRRYLVKKLPDAKEAADRLARINQQLTIFVKHMVSKYPDDDDVKRLYENFNPDNVSEGTSENGYTSYSINKGERIILCIRQKDTNEFVDENVVLYPAIHEIAHCAVSEIGHTPYFWRTFKWFLEEAVDIGVYKKIDYSVTPMPYCGIHLTTSVI
jgi:hypothetical protein